MQKPNQEMSPEYQNVLAEENVNNIAEWQGRINFAVEQAETNIKQLSRFRSSAALPHQKKLTAYKVAIQDINTVLNSALAAFQSSGFLASFTAIDAAEFNRRFREKFGHMADLENDLITLNANLQKDKKTENSDKKSELDRLIDSKLPAICETQINKLAQLLEELKNLSVERFGREDIKQFSDSLEKDRSDFEKNKLEFQALHAAKFDTVTQQKRGVVLVNGFKKLAKKLIETQKTVQSIVDDARNKASQFTEIKKQIEEHRASLAASYASMAELNADTPQYSELPLEIEYQKLLNPGYGAALIGLLDDSAEKPLTERSLEDQIKALKSLLGPFSLADQKTQREVRNAQQVAEEEAQKAKAKEVAQQEEVKEKTQKVSALKGQIQTYIDSLTASRASTDNIAELLAYITENDTDVGLEARYQQFLQGPEDWSVEGLFWRQAEKSLEQQITALEKQIVALEDFAQSFNKKDAVVGKQAMELLVNRVKEEANVVNDLKIRIKGTQTALATCYASVGDNVQQQDTLAELIDPINMRYQAFLEGPKLTLEQQIKPLNTFVQDFGVVLIAVNNYLDEEIKNAKIAAEKAKAQRIAEHDKRIEDLDKQIDASRAILGNYFQIEERQDISDNVKGKMQFESHDLILQDSSLEQEYKLFNIERKKPGIDREECIAKFEGFAARYATRVNLFGSVLNELVKTEKQEAEAARIAEEKAKAQEAEAARIAEEKAKAQAAEAARIAKENAEARKAEARKAKLQDNKIKELEKDIQISRFILLDDRRSYNSVTASLDWDYDDFKLNQDLDRDKKIERLMEFARKYAVQAGPERIARYEQDIAGYQNDIELKLEMTSQKNISSDVAEQMQARYMRLQKDYEAFNLQNAEMKPEEKIEKLREFTRLFCKESEKFTANLHVAIQNDQTRKKKGNVQPQYLESQIAKLTAEKAKLDQQVNGIKDKLRESIEAEESKLEDLALLRRGKQRYLREEVSLLRSGFKGTNKITQALIEKNEAELEEAIKSEIRQKEQLANLKARLEDWRLDEQSSVVNSMPYSDVYLATLKMGNEDSAVESPANMVAGDGTDLGTWFNNTLNDVFNVDDSKARKARLQKEVAIQKVVLQLLKLESYFLDQQSKEGYRLSGDPMIEIYAIHRNTLNGLLGVKPETDSVQVEILVEKAKLTDKIKLARKIGFEKKADNVEINDQYKDATIEQIQSAIESIDNVETISQLLKLKETKFNDSPTKVVVKKRLPLELPRVADEVADEVPDEVPDEVADEVPDEVADEVPGEVADEVPDEVADEVPDEVADEVPGEVADEVPGEELDGVPGEELDGVPDEELDVVPNVPLNTVARVVHGAEPPKPSKVYNKALNKHTDAEIVLGFVTFGIAFLCKELQVKAREHVERDLTPAEEITIGLFSMLCFVGTAGFAGVMTMAAVTVKTKAFGFFDKYMDKKAYAEAGKAEAKAAEAKAVEAKATSADSDSDDDPMPSGDYRDF